MLLDKIIFRELVRSPEDFAKEKELQIVSTETEEGARNAAKLPLEESVTFELTPAKSDWGEADQVAVELFVPEGAKVTASLRVNCSSHTPGLQGDDYMHVHYRYLHTGWGRVEFPYENFLIFGIPDQWRAVSMVSLTLSAAWKAELLLGNMHVERRERATGPRMTDEELFAELDLSRPALRAVAAAVEAQDYAKARKALARYFRNRRDVQHNYPQGTVLDRSFDTRTADQICRHFVLGQQLGPDLDWRANPIGYLEWMHAFNRHGFLVELVGAYRTTADERYAEKLGYLISTWTKVSPVPVGNNGGGDPAWETLSTACRINRVWPHVWFALQDSPAFAEDTRIDMLKSFYEHAEHLVPYPTGCNWLVAESQAMATVGILFPELRKASSWRNAGMKRLDREMARQVYPDGAQFELTAGYHWMCASLFTDIYELAIRNGYGFSHEFAQSLERMYEYLMHVTRPDGTRPSFNDASGMDGSAREALARGAKLFERADFQYVATDGREGTEPSQRSHAFEYAGHYVLRSGWRPADRYAIVDAGPFGSAHQHEDKLSLELYAYGTPFVVDPGIASYLDDPWTHHARHTAAHNTILVDGKGQNRRGNLERGEHAPNRPQPNLWASGTALDLLMSQYEDGYTDLDKAQVAAHHRAVVFVKPDYWLVWDVVEGRGEHTLEALYHFMPMIVQIEEGTKIARTNRLGRPNLELLPFLAAPALEAEVVCGSQDPVQGWVVSGGQLVPAPVVRYSLAAELPASLGLVAFPFETGLSSGIRVERIPLTVEGTVAPAVEGVAVKVARPNGTADVIILLRSPQTEVTFEDFTASGQAVLVALDPDGKLRHAALVNGTRLARGEDELLAADSQVALQEKTF